MTRPSANFRIAIVILTAMAISSSPNAQPLDEIYHNNAEILTELQTYARQHSNWMTLDSIGHSAEDSLPIWCAKISDNPRQIEPEAALLFIGQVHAEEVVGIEIALEIMKQMLDNVNDNRMRQRLEGLEIYIIPTANPEGLDVVMSGQDITFRKNKRDNIGDGQVRIFDGEGWDTSGVDINRNFGTHWDRGDTLFRPEETFRYNAYRGSAPFSEPESRAIRDLALSRPFLYSIVYHSSRSGNSTELFIAPWFWRENNIIKRPPDAEAINALGERVAGMIPGMRDRNSHYRPVQSMQRKGQLQDWFYIETGCIQFMAEVAATIHPDADSMRMVVEDNLPAVWYLMDLALGLEGLDGFGTLTVIATDAQSGEPVSAKLQVAEHEDFHPILSSRRTSQINGRFDWLLPEGEFGFWLSDVDIPGSGYHSQINDGERTVLEAELDRMESSRKTFIVCDESDGHQIQSQMILTHWRSNTLIYNGPVNGQVSLDLFPWLYEVFLIGDGYTPRYFGKIDIWDGEEFRFGLAGGGMAFHESFPRVQEWLHSGNNWGIKTFDGRSCLTDAVTGDYPTSSDLWLELPDIVSLDTARATMRIIHLPYCEPQDDYQQIEWWTNPEEVHTKRYSQLRKFRHPRGDDGGELDGPEVPDWDTLYISLDSLERGDLSVRFRTVSDEAIGEDGWLIDEVAVFVEGYVNSVPEFIPHPSSFSFSAFPNPFNSTVTISFSVPSSSSSSLAIYDINGRLVADLSSAVTAPSVTEGSKNSVTHGSMTAEHKVTWNASSVGAGVYFVRLETGEIKFTQKLLLLR